MGNGLKAFLGETEDEAKEVYERYHPLLKSIAQSYSASTGLDINDLYSEALMGLAIAKKNFDPDRSNDFKNFAIRHIKNTLHDFIRRFSSIVVIPSYVKKAASLLDRLQHCLLSHDVPPGDVTALLYYGKEAIFFDKYENICKGLFEKLYRAAERANISYQELVQRSYTLPTGVEITEYCGTHTIEDPIAIVDIRQYLTEEELIVVEGVYAGESLDEIGSRYGHSRTWAYNIMKRVRAKLASWL